MTLPLQSISHLPPDIQRKIILEVADLTQTLEEKIKFAQQLDIACRDPILAGICNIKDLSRNIWPVLYQHDISRKLPFSKRTDSNNIKNRYFFVLETVINKGAGQDLMFAVDLGYENLVQLLLSKLQTSKESDNLKQTILYWAMDKAKKNNDKEIIDILTPYVQEYKAFSRWG